MPSIPSKSSQDGRAEAQFREAFERLKRGKPLRVSVGTRISKNNVAREAGTVPSGLRGSRHPKLVSEIRDWIDAHKADESQQSARQKDISRRKRNKDQQARTVVLQAQRDDALAKLVMAEARILELTIEMERMRALVPQTKVAPLRPSESGKQK